MGRKGRVLPPCLPGGAVAPRPLALVTWQAMPRCCPDDAHLLQALDQAGVAAECVAWDAAEDWGRFAALLVRTPWDYYLRHESFLAWVGRIEALGVPLWNPPAVLRWNSDKRYLLEVAEQGLPVVPTRLVPQGHLLRLASIMDQHGWDDAVLKPAVSAGAHATVRVSRAEAPGAQKAFEGLVAAGDALVQPFVPEVARDGEWSLVFLGGRFSHALRKRPGKGDFRVQEKHGGSLGPATPTPDVVAQAARYLALPPGPLLYARVDGIVRDGTFVLMELEALEPELFWRTAPGSAARMVAALVDRLRAS